MKTIKTIKELRSEIAKLKSRGKRIGFVPTMGYLHEGHLSLVDKAKEKSDIVVLSIFVNPTQFGPGEDFERYPRDMERDSKLAEQRGVDLIFNPDVEEMYPGESFTVVEVQELTSGLCGVGRPGHFRGVTTVVSKLFNIVQPDIAVFGQKDGQQAMVIKRMTEDLNIPVEVIVAPTVREEDGLAMSSRNAYLSKEERHEALSLNRSLKKAQELIESGERSSSIIIEEIRKILESGKSTIVDYVSIVNLKDLKETENISGAVMVAVAAKVGQTRLIDNVIVKPN